jgi:hypothetical protein
MRYYHKETFWERVKKWGKWEWIVIFSVVAFILIFIFFRHKGDDGLEYAGIDKWENVDKLFTHFKGIEKKCENRVRAILEGIYRVPFPSVRPSFLKNPASNKNLELDCYNSNLNLAVEYNGIQHYKFVPRFHRSPQDLEGQKYRDNFKAQKCKELGINLIVVPYTVKYNDLKPYIMEELKKIGKL